MRTAIIDKTKEWTVADFLQLEETNLPCELIIGELFRSPAPNLIHQIIVGNLYEILKAYSRKTGAFTAVSPIDVFLDDKNVFQPDLLFLLHENRSKLVERGINGAPDLAVEVLSLSSSFRDRNQKRDLYQKFGIREYWIIDPENRTIDIYDFSAGEAPILHLIEQGAVTSRLLSDISFEFRDIFNP